MIVVSAMITIAEGKGDEYVAHFAKLAPLVRKDKGKPAIGEAAPWAQLQRLVQRRLRLLQRARGKTVEPDIPV